MSQLQHLIPDCVTSDTVETGNPRPSLAAEVEGRSRAGLNRCYHCRSCGNGCPFVQAMDYGLGLALELTRPLGRAKAGKASPNLLPQINLQKGRLSFAIF